jgi:hypothetical protein
MSLTDQSSLFTILVMLFEETTQLTATVKIFDD